VRLPCLSDSTRRKAFVTVTRSNRFFRRSTFRSAETTGPATKNRPMNPRTTYRITSGMGSLRRAGRKNQAIAAAKTTGKSTGR